LRYESSKYTDIRHYSQIRLLTITLARARSVTLCEYRAVFDRNNGNSYGSKTQIYTHKVIDLARAK
jgi:hypothetical protein